MKIRRPLSFDRLESRLPLSGSQIPVTVEPAPIGPPLGTQPSNPIIIAVPPPGNLQLDGTGPTADPNIPPPLFPAPAGSFGPTDPGLT